MSAGDHDCPSFEEQLENTRRNIKEYGLQVLMVKGTGYSPSFAYSIGLFETYNHPEIICFGLPQKISGQIINDVAGIIKSGQRFSHNEISLEIFKDSKAAFLNVDPRNVGDYFGHAISYYDHQNFPALQLVWTDRNDKLPWEDGFEEKFEHDQPLLDRNADFKFREAVNLGIYTTRQWLEDGKPILRILHEHDGDWQFLTGDQLPEDIRIVALQQLILRDGTLNEVFDLDYGESAERDFIGAEWVREKFDDEEDDDDE